MAVAFDASSDDFAVGASSVTGSHTCTGSDLVLLVGVLSTNETITGVTYNGVALAELGTTIGLTNGYKVDLWYLFGPDTGTHDIVSTKAGSSGNIFQIGASYTGVDQGGFDSSNQVDYVDTATATTSTTVVADDCWLVLYAGNEGGVPAAGTDTTLREGSVVEGMYDSNGTVATGSVSLQTTQSGTTDTGHFIVSLAPSAAAGGGFVPGAVKALLGVGI